MRSLEELLRRARSAAPTERIECRDAIADHGQAAIGVMVAWLQDPTLGLFAVRVLEKVAGRDPAHRKKVLDVLLASDSSVLPDHVARGVADAVNRIPGGTARRASHGATRRRSVDSWPGDRPVSELELRFHEAMLDVYRQAGEATRRRRADGTFERGYWANYFLRAVRSQGGRAYARQLLRAHGTTTGFERLKEEGRLDVSMEALVLRPEYDPLFTDEDRLIAIRRLRAAGYFPPSTTRYDR